MVLKLTMTSDDKPLRVISNYLVNDSKTFEKEDSTLLLLIGLRLKVWWKVKSFTLNTEGSLGDQFSILKKF